jgi:hypothetical protein
LGRDHFLSFEPAALDAAAEWIAKQRALWNARLDVLETLLRDEDRAEAGVERRGKQKRKSSKEAL